MKAGGGGDFSIRLEMDRLIERMERERRLAREKRKKQPG